MFQRQACEIERLKMDKENLEHQLDNSQSFDTAESHTEEEFISLQARMKVYYPSMTTSRKCNVNVAR